MNYIVKNFVISWNNFWYFIRLLNLDRTFGAMIKHVVRFNNLMFAANATLIVGTRCCKLFCSDNFNISVHIHIQSLSKISIIEALLKLST